MTSTSGSVDEMTAEAIFEAERQTYIERMAGIQDYWGVVESNVSPLPEVRFFEKTGTTSDGVPEYRQVPPHELAQRETQANPEVDEGLRAVADDPAAMLGAFADALNVIGDVLNTELPGISGATDAAADGFRDAGSDIAQQEAEDDQEQDALEALLDATDDLFFYSYNGDDRIGVYYPERPSPQERFSVQVGRRQVEAAEREAASDPTALVCYVTRLKEPADWEDPDGNVYTIESGERWSTYAPTVRNPDTGEWRRSESVGVYLKVEGYRVTPGGYQRFVIERETDRYRPTGPLIPHRTRQRLQGFVDALGEVVDLPEVVETIQRVESNDGPPTQEQVSYGFYRRGLRPEPPAVASRGPRNPAPLRRAAPCAAGPLQQSRGSSLGADGPESSVVHRRGRAGGAGRGTPAARRRPSRRGGRWRRGRWG